MSTTPAAPERRELTDEFGRYQLTLDVSMFAYDPADARMLADMIRDKLAAWSGHGQTCVRVKQVEPVTAPGGGMFNE